jgi:hypothetical protein
MRKIKYLIQCVLRMNLGRMIKTSKKIAGETGRLSLVIFFDVIWCGMKYGAGYVDYELFRFWRLHPNQRRTFVTRGANNELIRKLNNKNEYYKFEDKRVFNEIFCEYVKRKWLALNAGADNRELGEFFGGDTVVMVKPVDSVCGQGIERVKVLDIVPADYDRIVEEYIIQHEELSRVYSGAVNTLRLVTVKNDWGVHVVSRVLRMGAGGAVDNFNAGGVLAGVDENGTVFTDAINEHSVMFDTHPVSGAVFKGFEVPLFEQAVEMVTKAAVLVPGIRYVGWDVAFTQDYPLIIEANHNPGNQVLQAGAYLTDYGYGLLPQIKQLVAQATKSGTET